MKRTRWTPYLFAVFLLFACSKNNDSSQVSLTASTTQATIGQTVSVTVSTNKNASSWTVTPSLAVSKTYSLTTAKVNYITFNQPGLYTVAVTVKNINYDSTHQSLASCWQQAGNQSNGCGKTIDTASVKINVVK